MRKIGFVVNPIAGMGGSVGLKGTDGLDILKEAVKRGAKPIAPSRAKRFLREVKRLNLNVKLLTASNVMGEDYCKEETVKHEVILNVKPPTSREDTIRAAKKIVSLNVNIIVFVGGDGTARDILDAVDEECIVIGVPSGVKMYSSVFAIDPEAAARILKEYLEGVLNVEEREVLDIDENMFRRDKLNVKLYGYLKVPVKPLLIQSSKLPSIEANEYDNRVGIANYLKEIMEEDTIYILGPGSTIKTIAETWGVRKTLLGVDIYYKGRIISSDVDERELLRILSKFRDKRVKLILTPIGGQGFILGRGNQQLTPKVLRTVGLDNLLIVATRSKIKGIKYLRVDTGDPLLDSKLRGKYVRVIVDYNEELMMKIC